MADRTPYQKKVIQRYYANRQTIALQKLGELVSELYMAVGERQLDRLWDRVRSQMVNLNVPDAVANHIMAQRDVEILARNLQDWLNNPPEPG